MGIYSQMDIFEKINQQFDNQIYKYSLDEDTIHLAHRSKLHKQLFNLTFDFTLEDWNKIRTPKYWNTLDSIKDEDKKKEFTLQCVKYYLRNER